MQKSKPRSDSPIKKQLARKLVSYFDKLDEARTQERSIEKSRSRSKSISKLASSQIPLGQSTPQSYDDVQSRRQKLDDLKELMRRELLAAKVVGATKPNLETIEHAVHGYPSFMRAPRIKEQYKVQPEPETDIMEFKKSVHKILEQKVKKEDMPELDESSIDIAELQREVEMDMMNQSKYSSKVQSSRKEGDVFDEHLYPLDTNKKVVAINQSDSQMYDFHQRKSKEIRRIQYASEYQRQNSGLSRNSSKEKFQQIKADHKEQIDVVPTTYAGKAREKRTHPDEGYPVWVRFQEGSKRVVIPAVLKNIEGFKINPQTDTMEVIEKDRVSVNPRDGAPNHQIFQIINGRVERPNKNKFPNEDDCEIIVQDKDGKRTAILFYEREPQEEAPQPQPIEAAPEKTGRVMEEANCRAFDVPGKFLGRGRLWLQEFDKKTGNKIKYAKGILINSDEKIEFVLAKFSESKKATLKRKNLSHTHHKIDESEDMEIAGYNVKCFTLSDINKQGNPELLFILDGEYVPQKDNLLTQEEASCELEDFRLFEGELKYEEAPGDREGTLWLLLTKAKEAKDARTKAPRKSTIGTEKIRIELDDIDPNQDITNILDRIKLILESRKRASENSKQERERLERERLERERFERERLERERLERERFERERFERERLERERLERERADRERADRGDKDRAERERAERERAERERLERERLERERAERERAEREKAERERAERERAERERLERERAERERAERERAERERLERERTRESTITTKTTTVIETRKLRQSEQSTTQEGRESLIHGGRRSTPPGPGSRKTEITEEAAEEIPQNEIPENGPETIDFIVNCPGGHKLHVFIAPHGRRQELEEQVEFFYYDAEEDHPAHECMSVVYNGNEYAPTHERRAKYAEKAYTSEPWEVRVVQPFDEELQREHDRKEAERQQRIAEDEERLRRIREEEERIAILRWQEEERIRRAKEDEAERQRQQKIDDDLRQKRIKEEEERLRRLREDEERERLKRLKDEEDKLKKMQEEMARHHKKLMEEHNAKERQKLQQEEDEKQRRIEEEQERIRQLKEDEDRLARIRAEEERIKKLRESEDRRRREEDEERYRRTLEEEEKERRRRIEEDERIRKLLDEQEKDYQRRLEEEERRRRQEDEEERERRRQEDEERRQQLEREAEEAERRYREKEEELKRKREEDERIRRLRESDDKRRREEEEELRRRREEEERIKRLRESDDRRRREEEEEERRRQADLEKQRQLEDIESTQRKVRELKEALERSRVETSQEITVIKKSTEIIHNNRYRDSIDSDVPSKKLEIKQSEEPKDEKIEEPKQTKKADPKAIKPNPKDPRQRFSVIQPRVTPKIDTSKVTKVVAKKEESKSIKYEAKQSEKPAEKAPEKPQEKPAEKAPETQVDKISEKSSSKKSSHSIHQSTVKEDRSKIQSIRIQETHETIFREGERMTKIELNIENSEDDIDFIGYGQLRVSNKKDHSRSPSQIKESFSRISPAREIVMTSKDRNLTTRPFTPNTSEKKTTMTREVVTSTLHNGQVVAHHAESQLLTTHQEEQGSHWYSSREEQVNSAHIGCDLHPADREIYFLPPTTEHQSRVPRSAG